VPRTGDEAYGSEAQRNKWFFEESVTLAQEHSDDGRLLFLPALDGGSVARHEATYAYMERTREGGLTKSLLLWSEMGGGGTNKKIKCFSPRVATFTAPPIHTTIYTHSYPTHPHAASKKELRYYQETIYDI